MVCSVVCMVCGRMREGIVWTGNLGDGIAERESVSM